MSIHDDSKQFLFTFLLVLLAVILGSSNGFCDVVSRKEAVAVADFWFAAEINADHTKMDPQEKADRLANLPGRKVLYYTSENKVSGAPPKKGSSPPLAFIIKYEPTGFVVVSGEDRIRPVLVFDVKSDFRFDQLERNFMPFYLEKTLGVQWKALREGSSKGKSPPVHSGWTELRSKVNAYYDPAKAAFGGKSSGNSRAYVLWDTALWSQGDPYNDTARAHNGNHNVPTGCVATAMAIKMRYHQWPNTGTGSHSYDDDEGSIQYSHSANFGAHTYDWSEMPAESLDPAQAYPEVADLMYHCGVAVEMNYELSESGAATGDAPWAMEDYFRYRGFFWNTSSHETDLRNSILGGLPGLMRWDGHAMVADGYRDTGGPYFHVNLGWNGGSNSWYNLDDVLGHEILGTAPYGQPDNWTYVNPFHIGAEAGLLWAPFNTLTEGNLFVPSGGQLWLYGTLYTGTGNVPIVFNKAMEIKPHQGTVIIQ